MLWPNASVRQVGTGTNHFLPGAGRFFLRELEKKLRFSEEHIILADMSKSGV